MVIGTGCGWSPSLDGGLGSPREVAQAVVRALDARDLTALERLGLSEREFREVVWPRQPAARPERNIPWDYAWRSLAAKSRFQLRGRLNEWSSSRNASLVGVDFTGETTDYGTYRVHRRSAVTLRRGDGTLATVRLFGSMIEQGGRYKVFSYVVD
jgi:hypothetical protein